MLLEIKRLMQIMVIINDLPAKVDNIELDCLVGNLQAFDCRKGCPNCSANELFNKLENAYGKKGFDSGKLLFIFVKREKPSKI